MNFFTRTNWLLIFALIFGSAALSVLGDSLGSLYGKKRITLFGLRPKRTSQLITAMTGAFIAVGILTVMSIFSQDVRTALFGMKMLRQEMYDLQFQLNRSEENTAEMRASLAEASANLELTGFELDSMKNDKLILEQEKKELEASLKIMREESEQLKHDLKAMKSDVIALSANVLLGQAAFEPGMMRVEIISGLNALKQQVRLNVLTKISDQSFTRLRDVPINFDEETEAALINELASSDIRQYVRALSGENYTLGENLKIDVILQNGPSIITYRKGEPVYRKFFTNDKENSPEEILHVFLRELRNKVISDGILPDPSTNNVGTLEGEAFFSAVEELGEITEPVIISAVAKEDIYTEGPVMIEIIFEE
ncbi:MAG: DUF3084 domain-containing protein [Synergistaceae bacterium]|nr:DUF3084 domain-containing protein [Synergistaceae bacterium]